MWKHSGMKDSFDEFAAKMRAGGYSAAAIRAFQHGYEKLVAGETG